MTENTARPTVARLHLKNGDTVDCLIEQTGPHKWQAVPITDTNANDIASTYIDILPGGHSISFVVYHEEN